MPWPFAAWQRHEERSRSNAPYTLTVMWADSTTTTFELNGSGEIEKSAELLLFSGRKQGDEQYGEVEVMVPQVRYTQKNRRR